MSRPNQAFGIMDQGYFVPRGEIIAWLNQLLHINLPKIEALGAGNVYCQILDVIYPGKIPMNKVNWKVKLDYEFISNLKVLQNCFDKLGIKKHIDVEKISKAKYQDNLELAQWFKRYYDVNCGGRGENYSAEQRRSFVEPDFSFSDKTVVPKSFNGGGQIISSGAPQMVKPNKNVEHQPKTPSNNGPSYQNQNVNHNNNIKPMTKTKSASDEKLDSILKILSEQLSNDQKVQRITGIMGL